MVGPPLSDPASETMAQPESHPRRALRTLTLIIAAAVIAMSAPAAAMSGSGHEDPVAGVVLALLVILAAAKIAGDLAVRAGQPAVLGELLAGVALGNLDLLGVGWAEGIASNPTVDSLARLGSSFCSSKSG